MKIFDLHCHPTLKPLLSLPKKRPTPWETIKVCIDNTFDDIYDSQTNFEQLLEGGCNLACVGLMALETEFVKRCIVKVLAGPVKYIDRRQVRRIGRAKRGYTYEDLLSQEIDSVIDHPINDKEPSHRVKFINSLIEYDADDMNTLHVIGSLEGAHSLYYGRNKYDDHAKIVDKIASFRQGNPIRLLYLTVTHISQNAMANHAFGIKIFKKTHFFPQGSGITELGHQVIQACQAAEGDEKPILIDVKHMSLVSRMEFYAQYAQNPIVASHIGVTGCSYHNKPIKKVRKRNRHDVYKVKYEKQQGYMPDVYFHPDSINLYDEDIDEILKSGGLMGLILDERVLGYSKDKTTSKEFVSASEWDRFIAPDNAEFPEMDDSEDAEDDSEDTTFENEENGLYSGSESEPTEDKKKLHTMYLLNNIMHIIKVGDKIGNGIDPRKHIVLGSDFDGLVNPIDSCHTAKEYQPNLRDRLAAAIEVYASDIIPDTNAFLDDFFYNNGMAFLQRNF